MHDIVISKERIKIELKKIMIFFVVAFILNIYSIIKYNTKWIEIFTQLHWVMILTGVLYVFSLIILGIKLLVQFFKK